MPNKLPKATRPAFARFAKKLAFVRASTSVIGTAQSTIRRVGNSIIGGDFTGDPRGQGALDLQVIRNNPGDVASGDYSMVIGNTGRAAGNSASAIGSAAVADGDYASALGTGANALGARSIAIGYPADAEDDDEAVIAGTVLHLQHPGGIKKQVLTEDDWALGYTAYDARYVQKAGDTMTGALAIEGGADVTQLAVRGAAAQSANLQEWRDVFGNVLTYLASDGSFYHGSGGAFINFRQTTDLALNPFNFDVNFDNGFLGSGILRISGAKFIPADDVTNYFYGFRASYGLDVYPTKINLGMTGILITVGAPDSGNISDLHGADYIMKNSGGGRITNFVGAYVLLENLSGRADTAYGVWIDGIVNHDTVPLSYALYIGDQTAASVNYALYTGRGDIRLMSDPADQLGFWGAAPIPQPTVTGSRGSNAALASLLTQLAALGLIVDSST